MVVIEIIGSEGKTPRFERPRQSVIHIGRALDNDVIIDDPYIDAHHIVLDTSEEHWHVTDLDSANGTFKARNSIKTASVESGDELLIGKTHIRIFSVDHQVPAARSLRDLEHLLLSFDSIAAMVTLVAVLAVFPCLELYLTWDGHDIKLDSYLSAGISLLASSLAIAALLSLISRLLRGEARFRVLFNITMLTGLISALLRPVIGVIAYNFPGAGIEKVANPLVSGVLIGVYVYLMLLLGTRLSSRLNQAIAILLATASIGSTAITAYSRKDVFSHYPRYDGAVYAPAFLARNGDTPPQFLGGLPDVFAHADELAAEEANQPD